MYQNNVIYIVLQKFLLQNHDYLNSVSIYCLPCKRKISILRDYHFCTKEAVYRDKITQMRYCLAHNHQKQRSLFWVQSLFLIWYDLQLCIQVGRKIHCSQNCFHFGFVRRIFAMISLLLKELVVDFLGRNSTMITMDALRCLQGYYIIYRVLPSNEA